MFGSRWDCDACYDKQRRQSYVCPRRGGTIQQAFQRLSEGEAHPNLLARYDYAGVCPHAVVAAVPAEFISSIPWYDKGALGIPFHRVPAWYKQAISTFEHARNAAFEMKQAEK